MTSVERGRPGPEPDGRSPRSPDGLAEALDERSKARHPPRRVGVVQMAHERCRVADAGVHEQAVEDVRVATQVRAAHPAALGAVGDGTHERIAISARSATTSVL